MVMRVYDNFETNLSSGFIGEDENVKVYGRTDGRTDGRKDTGQWVMTIALLKAFS